MVTVSYIGQESPPCANPQLEPMISFNVELNNMTSKTIKIEIPNNKYPTYLFSMTYVHQVLFKNIAVLDTAPNRLSYSV